MSTQGLSAAASSLAAAQVREQVAVAVAKQAQSVAKAQGEAAVSLLNQAAELQQQLTPTPGLEPGKGVSLDVYA